MKRDVIYNPENLDRIRQVFAQGGIDQIHVLADFDRILTQAFVDDQEVPAVMYILHSGGYLSEDYTQKAQALFEKYHPIEIDPQVPLAEKKRAMEEWWRVHFELLIRSGLSRDDLRKVLASEKIRFRDGVLDFLDFLHEHGIPLVIMSSSGLGDEMISMCLEQAGRKYDNIHIVSNAFEWDENGKAIRVKEPVIHVANKDETVLSHFPFFEAIRDRRNVILLGDNIEDVGMIEGFDYNNLLKIGFLNKDVDVNLPHYRNNFDVVITRDSSMEFVNDFLRNTFETREGKEGKVR